MQFWRTGALGFFFITSCTFTDKDSFAPAYLIMSDPSLTVRQDEGAPVNGIKDAWVIVDGQLLGVFPIPAKVPIIPTGKSMTIQVNAGVKENADKNTSVEYPFYVPVKKNIDVESGERYNIDMAYEYKEETYLDFTEGFESSFHLLTKDIDGDIETRISLTDEDQAYGFKSGVIRLDKDHNEVELTTENFYSNVNNLGGNVYLEFDYKSEEVLYVGTEVNTPSSEISEYKVLLTPTPEWKRAYINFTQEISRPAVQTYRVLFRAFYEVKSKDLTTIYLDNIKLVHF
ncbi:MAG: hypothetical protein IPN29_09240 [Saprospiraceae bacterium]|nr:hypothetical protein [Saprospiraceae bacterium]